MYDKTVTDAIVETRKKVVFIECDLQSDSVIFYCRFVTLNNALSFLAREKLIDLENAKLTSIFFIIEDPL